MKKFKSKTQESKGRGSYIPDVKNLGLGGKVHPPEMRKKKKKKSFAEALQN